MSPSTPASNRPSGRAPGSPSVVTIITSSARPAPVTHIDTVRCSFGGIGFLLGRRDNGIAGWVHGEVRGPDVPSWTCRTGMTEPTPCT